MDSISVEGLSLEYEGKSCLGTIDCTFHRHELTIITGPNGSGKSLLLRSLAGLVKAQQGSVRVNGADKRVKPSVALVFQDPLVQILGLTVEEDIRFGLENMHISKDERESRLQEALTWTNLLAKRHQDCRSLSGGERRRLCIASILVMDPDFILLDEPFSNLDYQGVKEVLGLILKLKTAGKGIIVVSHDLDRVLAHADRLILMKSGRIIADALPERVLPYLEDHGVRRPSGKIADMTWHVQDKR